ncbi:ATP-binding protein [Sulfitobacter donghicola]|uniref:Anti-sigma B factor n=1 Tax=Sulfitobacter donghicola DSW-25 = KCTC 12864 = JCM 14565 TaxID=1300350 RepID=A0A073ILE8_9RHOB|nr:ATP-binding protein [Sulfitobacter donghicola]KEJ90410.1 anti-sigma B factor [Sulfitobacter donghicola DSW-25 = KCTC 12864 = JCM 14565]KIN67640.1 putative serine-protein kinase [Sulfitobacter donghicola DSW-25 = KCTC 12864 = JCM 14565]
MPKHTLPFSFVVTLAGKEDAIRSGLAQTLAGLEPLGLNNDETTTVELVLAEALNNVVEHALASTNGETEIEIRTTHDDQGLLLVIVDQGVPMPTGTAPACREPELAVALDDMPEGGFGWFMIHTLTQEIDYKRVEDTNQLSLRLPVGLQPQTPTP